MNEIFKNWITSLAGLLVGIPPVIAGSGITLTPLQQHILFICAGVGAVLLGLASKDFNKHSTIPQVEKATATTMVAQASDQNVTVIGTEPKP